MSLQVKFDISDDCVSFNIQETTLEYEATNNPTGYGTPNTDETSINACTIVLLSPSGISYTFNDVQTGTDTLTNPYPTYFPDALQANTYNIPSSALGLSSGDPLEEGLWKFTFTWEALDLEETYTKVYYYMVTCAAECCIQKMLLQVKTTECKTCTDTVLDKVTQLYMFLEVAKTAAEQNQPVLAQTMIDQVNLICGAFDCNSCN